MQSVKGYVEILEKYPRDGYAIIPGLLPSRVIRGRCGSRYFTAFQVLRNGDEGLKNYSLARREYLSSAESQRDFRSRVSCICQI